MDRRSFPPIAALLLSVVPAAVLGIGPARAAAACPATESAGRLVALTVGAGAAVPVATVERPSGEQVSLRLDGLLMPAVADRAPFRAYAARLADAQVGVLAAAAADRRGRLGGDMRLAGGQRLALDVLARGLAIADRRSDGCDRDFFSAEAVARKEKRGIWRSGTLITSAATARLAGPDFVVLSGTIRSVGQAGATTFLDFGRNHRTDATIRADRKVAAALAAAGHAADSLAGRRVEARGWAVPKDGLELVLERADDLVVLDGAGTD